MMSRRSLFFAASAIVLSIAPAHAGQMSQTLNGRSLTLENLRANVEIKVDPTVHGYQVRIDGKDELTKLITMGNERDDVAFVRMEDDYGYEHNYNTSDMGVHVTILVPATTDLAVDGFLGTMNSGDLGALALDVDGSGTLVFGSVNNAAIDASGSGDVTLGDVHGQFAVSTSGSGKVKAGNAGATSISISGSGDADIASVNGALGVEVNGSADITIGAINGAAQIEISGSGSVTMRSGTANPLMVDASGSGAVYFNGTAVNPMIDASGSGGVCIAKVEGAIQLDGSHVKIDPNACARS